MAYFSTNAECYVLACIKLMINTCTVMVNQRLNVSLRSLATNNYNILFFVTGSKATLKNENIRKIETLKKKSLFKKKFKASRQTFLSQRIIPVKTICRGREKCL